MTRAGVLVLGLLTVAVQVGLLAGLGLALSGGRGLARLRIGEALLRAVRSQALALSWLVALVSMGGSLYLSEVAHLPPCTLCWYQRIAMYALAAILSVAVWRRDRAVRPYVLALASLGLPISAYHYLLEWFPGLESTACDPTNPCSIVWVRLFGYVSIPMMAATAFACIGGLMLVGGGMARRPSGADGARLDSRIKGGAKEDA